MTSFRSRPRPANAYDLLPPERPRPRAVADRLIRPVEVEDAEFVVIRDYPGKSEPRSAAPVNRARRPGNDNGRHIAAANREPITALSLLKSAAGFGIRVAERALGRLSVNHFSALVTAVFLLVFALSGGLAALAGSGRPLPDVGTPIAFTHVTVSSRTVNGMPMMVVNGIVENRGAAPLVSPRLRANVRSGGTMLSSTLFNPHIDRMETGESRGFQIKLPHAGGKTPEVELSLAE